MKELDLNKILVTEGELTAKEALDEIEQALKTVDNYDDSKILKEYLENQKKKFF